MRQTPHAPHAQGARVSLCTVRIPAPEAVLWLRTGRYLGNPRGNALVLHLISTSLLGGGSCKGGDGMACVSVPSGARATRYRSRACTRSRVLLDRWSLRAYPHVCTQTKQNRREARATKHRQAFRNKFRHTLSNVMNTARVSGMQGQCCITPRHARHAGSKR